MLFYELAHFRGRRKGEHFAEKKVAAQEFMADLKAASGTNPGIMRLTTPTDLFRQLDLLYS